jgi:hypothetical protein
MLTETEKVFTEVFNDYVFHGDTIEVEKDGFILKARIEHDDENPKDYDEGISDEMVRRFNKGEWFYCGIVISVSKRIHIENRVERKVVISEHAASLWGLECNVDEYSSNLLMGVADELALDALDFAKEVIKQLAA